MNYGRNRGSSRLAEQIPADDPDQLEGVDDISPSLHGCIYEDLPEMFEWLLDRGANMELREQDYGATPLTGDVVHRHKRIIRILVERGADTTAVGSPQNPRNSLRSVPFRASSLGGVGTRIQFQLNSIRVRLGSALVPVSLDGRGDVRPRPARWMFFRLRLLLTRLRRVDNLALVYVA